MWKFTTDRPVYLQIIDEIMLRIASGTYKPGERLPSVRELAEEARVTPNTVQKALSEIERAGYIISLRTSGKFVTDDVLLISKLTDDKLGELIGKFTADLDKLGIPVSDAIKLLKEYDMGKERDK